MKEGITGFLYENPTTKSSKTLLAIIFACYAMLMTTLVYWLSEDYVALIAVWGTLVGTVLLLVGIGKYQENEKIKIQNGHKPQK